MKSWSIGEVARFLGIKPYIIRYWESELPLLSPRKGLSGRREYSSREIRLLMRFRYLLHEKKFTIEGAKRRMWEELGAGEQDTTARFDAMRADLVEALMTLQRGRHSEAPSVDSDGEGATELGRNVMTEKQIRETCSAHGQEHLFQHWEARPARLKQRLLSDLASLDFGRLEELRARLRESAPGVASPAPVPAPYVALDRSARDTEAKDIGDELIRRGKTALLTVAGGQGSRLGFDGPKGMFAISPLRKLTLFALHAEKLLAARRWYGAQIPWLIMTSPSNRTETEEYFRRESWFGLGSSSVLFFSQGTLPSLSPEGGLLMAPDGGLFFNPNGHGGVISALNERGVLQEMRDRGVEELSSFQVDNPLVRAPDPVFLGFHRKEGSDISSKVIEKAYAEEKLGVISLVGGKPCVIEYSDFDENLMRARGPDGKLTFSQGSIAIHALKVDFLSGAGLSLPLHIARKKVKALKPTPQGTEIGEEDAVKMEMFIFDAIPMADKAIFFETERAEEFAPLKNREGMDSIETCIQGQVEKAARWLSGCGVDVPRDGAGQPAHLIEISALFAWSREALAAKRASLQDRIDEDTLLA
ncbi:MAG TPA: UTP--glucose-1-phosphate uridylyltransferase [Spirochaetia bacterium]|nr:UTP--glucose-1-phosphate uridylyltransferase [Spirochaetia bacterium]